MFNLSSADSTTIWSYDVRNSSHFKLKRISPSHTFQKMLLTYDSLLNKENRKCRCSCKECMETAKKANNFWKSPLFGNIRVIELRCLNKSIHHISFWKYGLPKYVKRINYYATQFFWFTWKLLRFKRKKDKSCQEMQEASCRHCDAVEKHTLWSWTDLFVKLGCTLN